MARKTKAEKEAEAKELLEAIAAQIKPFIIEGHSFDHIRQFIEREAPKIAPQAAIEMALEQQSQDASALGSHAQHLCVNIYRALIQQMRKVGDFPGALRATDKLEKLTRYPVSNAEQLQADNLNRILQ